METPEPVSALATLPEGAHLHILTLSTFPPDQTEEGDDAMRARSGFTLIELLIVVVVLGILAAVAIARMNSVSREANLAVLRSDLRSMTVLQEIHHQTQLEYAALGDLEDFRTSDGVDVTLTWLDRNGYAAIGTHAALPDLTCGVFRGPAADGVAAPATEEGAITCQ